jgi:hypothetical protein
MTSFQSLEPRLIASIPSRPATIERHHPTIHPSLARRATVGDTPTVH